RAPGLRWFVDNCHPRAQGQFLMAEAMARALCAAGWLAPPARWRWENLPAFAECAATILTPEEWRDQDRTTLLSLLESDPARGIDLARYPPAVATDPDPEWTALHALALWRCGFRAEAGLAWDRLAGPHQAAAHEAVKGWPETVQQWWAEMQTSRTACK